MAAVAGRRSLTSGPVAAPPRAGPHAGLAGLCGRGVPTVLPAATPTGGGRLVGAGGDGRGHGAEAGDGRLLGVPRRRSVSSSAFLRLQK